MLKKLNQKFNESMDSLILKLSNSCSEGFLKAMYGFLGILGLTLFSFVIIGLFNPNVAGMTTIQVANVIIDSFIASSIILMLAAFFHSVYNVKIGKIKIKK